MSLHLKAGSDGNVEHELGWAPGSKRSLTWPSNNTNKPYRRQLSVPGDSTRTFDSHDSSLRPRASSYVHANSQPLYDNASEASAVVGTARIQRETPIRHVTSSGDIIGITKPPKEAPIYNLTGNENATRVVTSNPLSLDGEISESSMSSRPRSALSTASSHVPTQIEPQSPRETGMEELKKMPEEPALQKFPLHAGLEHHYGRINKSSHILRREIRKQRIHIWALRSEIHSFRARLREKEYLKAASEDALFKYIKKTKLLGADTDGRKNAVGDSRIEELLEECQAIRDEYGPEEADIIQREDELSSKEFLLNRMEEELDRLVEEPPTPLLDDVSVLENDRISVHLGTHDEFEMIDLHPLATEFLSKLGDLDLLQETLDDLFDDDFDEDEDDGTLSAASYEPPTAEFQIPSDDSQTAESVIEEIEKMGRVVQVLREQCFSRGLIDEYDEPTNIQSQEQTSFSDEEDINPKDNVSEYVKYPILLPRPGSKHAEIDDIRPKPNEKSDNTTNRINQWLLDRLRTSALDVVLLASVSEKIFEGNVSKPSKRWELCVLSFWYEDGGAEKNRAYSSSLTTHNENLDSVTSDDYYS